MKQKLFLLILSSFIFSYSFCQLIQASLGPGSESNRVKIYLKPAATQTPSNISTLQFNLGVSSAVMPKPTMTIVSTIFPGVTWGITEATEGGFYNFQITTAASPIQFNTTANTEFEALEVAFTGGPVSAANVALVTLPDGGLGTSNGNSLFLSTGSLQSDGNNLYYSRPGVTVANAFSYDASGATSGTTASTAIISGVILPVQFLDFVATKNASNAILNWTIANQVNNDHFDIELSKDGRSFTRLDQVKATSASTYEYTHQNIDRISVPNVYYRIKQVDKGGQFTYSPVRKLQLNNRMLSLGIGENPVKGSGVKVLINASEEGRGTLRITDISGKVVYQKQTNWSSGTTNYTIDISSYSSGSYILSLVNEQEKLQVKFIK